MRIAKVLDILKTILGIRLPIFVRWKKHAGFLGELIKEDGFIFIVLDESLKENPEEIILTLVHELLTEYKLSSIVNRLENYLRIEVEDFFEPLEREITRIVLTKYRKEVFE